MRKDILPGRQLIIGLVLAVLTISVTGCGHAVQTMDNDISTVKTKTVHVADIDVGYKEMGKGYPLILIMGFSGTMELWSPIMLNELAENNRVIIFDNRGIGGTTASAKAFTISLFAADTSGLMDALNIKTADILGWSMGTYTAQELALNYPEKVNRLILLAADCGGKEAILPSPDILEKLADTSGSPDERGERMLKLMLPEKWLAENPNPALYMQEMTETVSPESIEGQFTAMMNWAGTYSRLYGISQRTLLITGTEDILTPPQNSLMMVDKIPAAWLVQYPGGGHGVMFQKPEEIARLINVFLSGDNNARSNP